MKKYLVPLILSLAFFLTGIFTISDYGINWDSQCRMMRGQAFIRLLLGGQKTYPEHYDNRTIPIFVKPNEYVTRYDFVSCEGSKKAELTENPLPRLEYQYAMERKRISFYQHPAWDGEAMLVEGGTGHPPLPEILGSISNRIMFGWLGILGDIESFSLIYLLISAVGVFVVTIFTIEITGSILAGIVAGISLALYPLFFSEAHFNLKDPLQASLYAGVVWGVWHWVKDKNFKFQISNFKFPIWWGVTTIFLALAMAIKWNIVFLPVILSIWFLFIKSSEEFKNWFKFKKLLPLCLLALITSLLFLTLIWPASWGNPLLWIQQLLFYYLSFGVGVEPGQPEGFRLPFGFNGYPLALFLTQTPEVVLLLCLIGGVAVFRGKNIPTKPGVLVLLVLIIPLLRYSLPFSKSYGGIRQVMEILPALAILSGIGFHYLSKTLSHLSYFKFLSSLSILSLLIIPIITLHPNQNVYFNNLVGGVKGAEKANLIDLMVTNGNVYKQGVEWLNQHAEKDAKLAITDGRMMAISPLWLREDISISPNHFSGLDKKGEYLLMNYTFQKRDYFAYHYPKTFLNPIHTIDVDGVPILYIFKNDQVHTKDGFKGEIKDENYRVQRVTKPNLSYYEIQLSKKEKVTRIVVTNYRRSCPDKDFYSFTDEFITFPNSDKVYAINERNVISPNQIEYSFPGEETDRVYIYPQSESSCFVGGKILSISVLK